jgi:1-deoxy-D-xylulose-5-phosphate reductoisomerase
MKKKIAILGSTGSIGKITFDILRKDKKNFDLILLTTNNNHKEILKQTKEFKVKNLVINNKKHYTNLKKKLKNKKINIYNDFDSFNKKFKSKVDYTMCAISGLAGLKPTLASIKFSKTIAIANKESLICAWNLIQKKILKYKTKFIPVDSEHFSIWSLLNGSTNSSIEEVIITASGGPFLKLPLKKFKKIKPKSAINHPNWKMGNKISIDSATLINKVFEVLEAQRIFNIDLNKFKIFIHPSSYVHSIIKFKNGLTKILVHDTNMKIPIINSIYDENFKKVKSKKLDMVTLNNLKFTKPDIKRFPSLEILKMITKKSTLFETVFVSANDQLVDLFLEGRINFLDITILLKKILRMKIFLRYKKRSPKNYNELINLSNYVRLKTRTLCI